MHFYQRTAGAVLSVAIAATGTVATAAPAAAQSYNYGNGGGYGSPPGYGNGGVANISVANGGVVIVRGDSGAQVAATVNAPVVAGDYVATSPAASAEVQFDGTSMLRMANNTQVRMVNLSPNSREVQLASGTVDLAQLQGSNGSAQVDTPSLSVRPNQTGDYRISVLGNGETLVTVRSGSATISSANGSQTLTPGSTIVANGTSINQQNPVAFDSFDQFNVSRDQSVVSSYNANPYVSPQLAGYSNFANYGQWQNVPGYGYAWAPNNQNQNNFAPYQNGQFVWEPGYGYTWVDNSPTGYATSHYGTWFNNPNYGGWLWQPPANQFQNSSTSLASAWLPAVVSFFLSGSNGSSLGGLGGLAGILGGLLGSGSGLGYGSNGYNFNGYNNANIGWIPLAPGEQYQPTYGMPYGQNYSYPQTTYTPVTNVTNIYNYYGNARYYRGITMVPISAWRSGNFRRVVVLRPQQFKQIVLIRGAVPVVPTTSNLHYTSAATVHHPIVLARAFTAPRLAAKAPAVTRASFAAQQSQVRSAVSVHPKVVPLSVHKNRIAPPVYHPVARAPVHVVTIKPVTHVNVPAKKSVRHNSAPAAKPAAKPATKPAAKPVTNTAAPAPKPVTHRTEKPAPVRTAPPAAKPVVHRTAAPVEKPVVHTAPVPKPIVHTAAPVAKPAIVHTAPPLVRTAPPIERPVPPVERPVAPVVHAAPPVARPAPVVHAAPAPVHPAPVVKHTAEPEKPAAHAPEKPGTHPTPKP